MLFAPQRPPRAERDALMRTWYRLNVLRIAAAAGASFAAYRAKRAITEDPGRPPVR
jgi:hypothetical protein